MRKFLLAVVAGISLLLGGCGYNDIQSKDEAVKAAWSEVLNQYKRRSDLIPNLVSTVEQASIQEKSILSDVVNARAKATSIQVNAESLTDPAKVQAFQKAQGELSVALGRLLAVTENYPQLQSIAGYKDLRAQLEGTENRITVARNRYIKGVQDYNTFIRQIPQNLTAMVFGYKEKPQFSVENEAAISNAPNVGDMFKKPAPAAQPAAPAPAPSK